MSVAFCSLLFVPYRASSNAVKRDISITKGMELAQFAGRICVLSLDYRSIVKDQ